MNSKIHIVIIAGLSLAMLGSTIVLSYGGHHVKALKTPKIWCFDTGVFGDVCAWSSKKRLQRTTTNISNFYEVF